MNELQIDAGICPKERKQNGVGQMNGQKLRMVGSDNRQIQGVGIVFQNNGPMPRQLTSAKDSKKTTDPLTHRVHSGRSSYQQFLTGLILCLSQVVTVTLFAADPQHRKHHHRDRVYPNVPPIEELEILDPRVDSEGKPRALVVPGENGMDQIQVPPTMIIHRYYYTGDRDFQGPMLQGGPVYLTVVDPASGEQIYCEALLPPGAPRIKYRRNRIVYEYRDRAIVVCFGSPAPLGLGQIGKPSVSVVHRPTRRLEMERQSRARSDAHVDWWAKTGLPDALTETHDATKSLATNTADALRTAGETATAPIKAAWRATPLNAITSAQERQPAFDFPIRR